MSATESIIGSGLFDVSDDMLGDVEGLCLQNLHMSRDEFPARYLEHLEHTREESAKRFDCKAMYQGFPIERIEGSQVFLASGTVLDNRVLADALAGAKEVVAFAVTVHGFEEVCGLAGNSGILTMFYGGWGSGYSMGSRQWLEGHVRNRAHEVGLYTGRSWFPGEDGLGMALQEPLANLLDLSQIGLQVKVDYIMHPTMSITGFIAVSTDPNIEPTPA